MTAAVWEGEIASALAAIPADDRETWVKIAMAVKSGLGEAGQDLWDAWSQTSDRYRARDAAAVWRSCKEDGGITIATLFQEARWHGWRGVGVALPPPSPDALRQRRAQAEAARAKRAQCAQAAAQEAQRMIEAAQYGPHPYLAAKGFPAARGLVLTDRLLLPIRDRAGALLSLQTIDADGDKRYLVGSRVRGGALRLGRRAPTRVYVEGYVTGLSVQAALARLYLDALVVVCFSAGNLTVVARNERRGVVVADHDRPPPTGGTPPGARAAVATGLPWWQPPEPKMDANDFHQARGLTALAEALRGLLTGGWEGDE